MLAAAVALAAAATPGECAVPPGWDAVERRHPRYIVFGESHGTVEAPAAIGRIACALAARQQRVLAAIEQQAESDQPELQTLWRLPRARFAAALAKADLWKGRDDGVGSRAMYRLLVRLHGLRGVYVVAFNGARDAAQRARFADQPMQGPHEAAQAENIRYAAAAHPYDRILVLTGSFHAGKAPATWQGETFRPMAMQLAPADQVVSLVMRHAAGGRAWQCQGKGDIAKGVAPSVTCASFPLGDPDAPTRTPRIVLEPRGDEPGAPPRYDGWYYLGRTAASPPLVPGR